MDTIGRVVSPDNKPRRIQIKKISPNNLSDRVKLETKKIHIH